MPLFDTVTRTLCGADCQKRRRITRIGGVNSRWSKRITVFCKGSQRCDLSYVGATSRSRLTRCASLGVQLPRRSLPRVLGGRQESSSGARATFCRFLGVQFRDREVAPTEDAQKIAPLQIEKCKSYM